LKFITLILKNISILLKSGNYLLGFLNIKNWTRLGKDVDHEEAMAQRPNILLSQFAIFGIILALIHTVNDYLQGLIIPAVIDAFLGSIVLLVYVLNEKKKHKAAKYLFILSLNILLFIFSNLIPKGTGAYLLFFPMIGGAFIFFGKTERKEKIFFVLISAILLIILEISGFQFFGPYSIQDTDNGISFLLNLIVSTIAFSFAINYLINLNAKAEAILESNKNKFKNLAKEIDKKNKYLEKANSELDRFVYSTSHDLRSPLMSILGLIDIAKVEPDKQKVYEYLDLMRNRVDKLDLFINDIIHYSRNLRVDPEIEPVNIDELISTIIEDHKFTEYAKEIQFIMDIDRHEDVKTDRMRLSVILNNLINNAIKYHDKSKDQAKVFLDVKKINGTMEISVKDNGVGIKQEDQKKIFEMFYRGSSRSNGSGLGLYIAQEMVSKLNGTIEVTSEFGKGTEFSISIPVMR